MRPKRRSRRLRDFRHVLFATDFSAASAGAWKQALDVARANRATLRIVHVVAPLAEAQSLRWAYRELDLVGSVAARVVATARCPVMTARSRRPS